MDRDLKSSFGVVGLIFFSKFEASRLSYKIKTSWTRYALEVVKTVKYTMI